ncbi:MAG: bifunctional oligoribonuclease/PAP phosphatase NrnA [Firmicutes bacterium]|nr:bifunctional oligoribonuclease/PAP phosphatase NrnA [Bacillota bacterium]
MNESIKQQILDAIVSHERIILSRHKRPDGDAIGSTKGLAGILRASFPGKEILVINEDSSEALAFLGAEDAQLSDAGYADALVIICDCAGVGRISNSKFSLGQTIVKIDHHIDISPFGDISWVEDWRSSTCEMIVDFYRSFSERLTLPPDAARCLYTGMVTDSGRFKFAEVTGETLRNAALLLEKGIDTQRIYANLELKDMDYHKFQAYALKKMKITENGVVHLHISLKTQEKFGLNHEAASSCVQFLSTVRGGLIWAAFIDVPDGSTRVRLRSRFLPINQIAEHYHGGGHAMASGATVYSREERKALLRECDLALKNYKEEHEDWL